MTSPRWVLALLAGASLVFAACSNSSTPNSTTTTTTHHRTTTTTSTSPSTTTSTSKSTTTTAGSTACDHVTASAAPGQGAAGTITGTVTVTNTGPTPCTANGYPKLALFSGSGAPLTVTNVNGLSVTLSPAANAPPSPVAVAPSTTAQFAYQFSDVPVGGQTSCPASETATVIMPGATTASPTFVLAINPCNNGTVKVSPLYAG